MHFLTFLKMSKILSKTNTEGQPDLSDFSSEVFRSCPKPAECFQYQFLIGFNRQSASLTDESIAARKAGKSKSLQVVDSGRCCRD